MDTHEPDLRPLSNCGMSQRCSAYTEQLPDEAAGCAVGCQLIPLPALTGMDRRRRACGLGEVPTHPGIMLPEKRPSRRNRRMSPSDLARMPIPKAVRDCMEIQCAGRPTLDSFAFAA